MALDPSYYITSNQVTTNTMIQGKDSSQLNMDDFLNLMVAQMTNQDMMNPMEDTEFIAQMAQFSSLQGIKTIQEYQLSNYAVSYAGKYVTIASQTATGELETITGYVEAVNFYDGEPKVQVNGKMYDLYTVMEVSTTAGSGSLGEASQYIGKTVTVAWKDEFDETQKVTGKVTAVTIKDNKPHIIIGGKEYPTSQIEKVLEDGATGEETDGDGED